MSPAGHIGPGSDSPAAVLFFTSLGPLSRTRSLGYVAGVVVLTLAILWIETIFDH